MPRPLALIGLLLLVCVAPEVRAEDGGDAGEAARREKGHADLVLDRYAHEFGTARQKDVLRTTITYTNASAKRLTGIRARGECGCNAVKLSHRELEPGASGTLEIEFHTLSLSGHLTKHVRLHSQDPSRGRIRIPLKVSIVEGLVVGSAGVSFGDVSRDTLTPGKQPTKSFSLRWYEGRGTPFEITELNLPEGFSSVTRPYRDAQDERWRGWEVTLTIEKPLPLGMYSAEVLVRTTNEQRARLTLPLSANICGKVWLQARRLSFGTFRQGRVRKASIKFRPFDDSVTFGEVRARSRSGRLLVEVKPDPYMAEKGYWKLTATVPADAEPGPLDDEVIELHTGAAGEETTLLAVRGRVKKAADGR
ncbi:MAG: DUF1573 domain-containing protein [Planctomycetota bacterium]|nr:DUF1573 domain-containing protein [Planctomycetota bacterium]